MPRWSSSGWSHSQETSTSSTAYPSRSRWRAVHGPDATNAPSVWYFGFGANINPWKLQVKRGIVPLAQTPGKVPGWRLMFNHKGGMGNVQPLDTLPPDDGPEAVHGILLELSQRDFEKLCQIEHEYRTLKLTLGRTSSVDFYLATLTTCHASYDAITPLPSMQLPPLPVLVLPQLRMCRISHVVLAKCKTCRKG